MNAKKAATLPSRHAHIAAGLVIDGDDQIDDARAKHGEGLGLRNWLS